MTITYRMLPLEEWDKLVPLYSALFPDKPFPSNPEMSCAAVAELDDKIIGFWFLHLCAHAEPVGVDPIDGKGVNLFSMLNTLMSGVKHASGMEYYISTPDPRLGDILEGSGFTPVGVLFSNKVP